MNIWFIFLAYASLVALGLSDNIRGPLFPEILKSFSLSDSQGSWFFSVCSTLSFLGSYGARFVMKRLGSVNTLRLSLVFMILGMLGIAYSPTFTLVLVASGFLGVSFGLMALSQNYMVSVGAPPHKLQQMMSGLHSMYGVASYLAPVLVASVAHVSNDWKSNFAFASLVPALVLISSLFYKSRKNRQSAHVHEDPNTLNDHKAQIYFGIIMATYVMSEILISTRLALYVRRTQLLDLAHSSLFVSYFFMFLLMGRIFFSFVKFRFPLRTQLMTSLILTLGCFLLGFWKSTQFFALCGLCMAPFYPLALTYASELFPASKMNSALSYILALSSFFIVIMNLTVGWVTDHFGIEQALWVGFVGALISLVLLFSLPVRFKKWFD